MQNKNDLPIEARMSPCVRDCRLKNNHCIGCGRSLDEIKCWSTMNLNEMKTVLKRLELFNQKKWKS